MKTTTELQARLEHLRGNGLSEAWALAREIAVIHGRTLPCQVLNETPEDVSACHHYFAETIELIEEILRLREEVSPTGFVKLPPSYKLENIPKEPVKWITGKPYRNE